MKRKAVNLVASFAELIRFFILMLLAGGLGALRDDGSSERIFRYAATPQLFFAAGLFFLWIDDERYGVYRTLLAMGKAVGLVAYMPVALLVASWLTNAPNAPQNSGRMFLLALFVVLIDLFNLAVLLLAPGRQGLVARHDHADMPSSVSSLPGQARANPDGEAGIEKVEV
jgi:hypothetical protein